MTKVTKVLHFSKISYIRDINHLYKSCKYEARSTKYETNTKLECSKSQNLAKDMLLRSKALFQSFGFGVLNIVSDFDILISGLLLRRDQMTINANTGLSLLHK